MNPPCKYRMLFIEQFIIGSTNIDNPPWQTPHVAKTYTPDPLPGFPFHIGEPHRWDPVGEANSGDPWGQSGVAVFGRPSPPPVGANFLHPTIRKKAATGQTDLLKVLTPISHRQPHHGVIGRTGADERSSPFNSSSLIDELGRARRRNSACAPRPCPVLGELPTARVELISHASYQPFTPIRISPGRHSRFTAPDGGNVEFGLATLTKRASRGEYHQRAAHPTDGRSKWSCPGFVDGFVKSG